MGRKRTDLESLDRVKFARLLQAGFEGGEGKRERITWELLVKKHWELLHSTDANVVQRELHWIEERVLGLGRSGKVSELPGDDRARMEEHLRELAKRAHLGGEERDDDLGKPAGTA
jgi:Fe-S cluster assembly ATPase SufC